ncbi:MAG TPA: cytochrome C oxidase subunit I [Puia sp.]|nr:cytochrome C oxidase subunit I [Puia sp.]
MKVVSQPSATHTSHKVVLPFYLYAAVAFLAATLLLFISAPALTGHFFQPKILAVTHTMALGWGTMIILGASYQLLPVFTESKLFSPTIAYLSFGLAAVGIPLLVYAFYRFDMGWPAKTGGTLIVTGMLAYFVNVYGTMGKRENIHALYCLTAAGWLLLATGTGLLLLFNFTMPFLPHSALTYLPLHAHIGIAGWFLQLIIGVGSRLIPMFLISKYENQPLLRCIYFLINVGLLLFLLLFFVQADDLLYMVPIASVGAALVLFGYYCYRCYQLRLRRRVERQLGVSLAGVGLLFGPPGLLIPIIALAVRGREDTRLVLIYGFIIFFGWITAIILGMTFKTLPFIVWNKAYHNRAASAQTPNPKDLVGNTLFSAMILAWVAGLLVVIAGIACGNLTLLRIGTAFLVTTAFFYNLNVWKLISHKPHVS